MKVRRVRGHVVGLDLSLTGTAACIIPEDWDLDLSKVQMVRLGYPLQQPTLFDKTERVESIVRGVVNACNGAAWVSCEDHAFGLAFTAHASEVQEMTGAVKREVYRDLGIIVEPVHASRARKVLLQKVPTKGAKKFTQNNVRRLGPIALAWTDDEIDSFVVANYAVMQVGRVCMTFEGTEEKPPRRPRKKA